MPQGSSSDIRSLVSEGRNPNTTEIDLMSSEEIAICMNNEDAQVARAVATQIPQIAAVIDRIVAAFANGGRLIYIGAGTSGRLGVLDASECPPTFSVSPDLVVGLIAGGDTALRHSVEDAEDDAGQGAADLDSIGVSSRDVVVGIAVSGKTPYVHGALSHAREIGAVTVGLSCNPASIIAQVADIQISPVVGPEALTGSTRLKSGTAQKMVLNMLSTGAMVLSGKTYGNLMVDVSVSNEKLAERAADIVEDATGCDPETARALLEKSGNNVKLAIFMQVSGLGVEAARAALDAEDGFLRAAIAKAGTSHD